jgi:hypothetical protein
MLNRMIAKIVKFFTNNFNAKAEREEEKVIWTISIEDASKSLLENSLGRRHFHRK